MNIHLRRCFGYTRDSSLRRQWTGWLQIRCALAWLEDAHAADILLKSETRAVVLIDMRTPNALDLVKWIVASREACVPICFAAIRSTPALEAEQSGAFEILPHTADRKTVQAAVGRASQVAELLADNSLLRERQSIDTRLKVPESETNPATIAAELLHSAECLAEPTAVLVRAAQALSAIMSCSRIAIFLETGKGSGFELLAATGGHPLRAIVPAGSPVASLLRKHGRVISRVSLPVIKGKEERSIGARVLEEAEADAIAPLFSKSGRMMGWVTVGGAEAGELTASDTRLLLRWTQQLSRPIEQSQDFHRTRVGNRIVEAIVNAIPLGIVALDENSRILWLNRSSEELFGLKPAERVGISISKVDLSLETAVAIFRENPDKCAGITHNDVEVPIEFHLYAVQGGDSAQSGFAVLILLRDVATEKELRDRRDREYKNEILSETTSFLAYSIRSPASVIKAFAQLLPERVEDKAFLRRCAKFVEQEANRLADLSDSIVSFADLKARFGSFAEEPFPIGRLIELLHCLAESHWKYIDLDMEPDLPLLKGNCARLAECVYHLIANARDAIPQLRTQRVTLKIARAKITKTLPAIEFTIADGRKVEKKGEFVDNSHLSSPSARIRADLRLSFASEIVREFSGDMILATADEGVTIRLLIPVA
jgi:nitrogen-specific signal transduction histidine kinase